MSCSTNQARSRLLNNINETSFTVNDILLYLDTHPNDQKALSYYRDAVSRRQNLMAEYARAYGPLTVDDASMDTSTTWNWMEQPFPWEKEGA
nr:spore coat protein CotJB [uncultured Blautia sp.]